MIFPLIISLVGLGYAFQEPTGLFISLNPIATRYKRDTNETEAIISKNDNIDAASTTETTEEVINKNKDLCNKKQLNEYYTDLEVCKTDAVQKFSDIYWEQDEDFLHSIESDKVLCRKYIAQASCYTDGGPRMLKCFDDATNQKKRLEFLYGLWKDFTNDTSSLGTNFIDSCSAFSNFKQDYLRIVAGCENCCSFEEYDKRERKRINCYETAKLSQSKRMDVYKTITDVTQAT